MAVKIKNDGKAQGLSGVGNDFKHQFIISRLIYELTKAFKKSKKNLIALPEYHHNEKVPDISILNKQLKPINVLEVCDTKGFEKDQEKIIDMMKKTESLTKCYILNKQTDVFYVLQKGKEIKIAKSIHKVLITNILDEYTEYLNKG